MIDRVPYSWGGSGLGPGVTGVLGGIRASHKWTGVLCQPMQVPCYDGDLLWHQSSIGDSRRTARSGGMSIRWDRHSDKWWGVEVRKNLGSLNGRKMKCSSQFTDTKNKKDKKLKDWSTEHYIEEDCVIFEKWLVLVIYRASLCVIDLNGKKQQPDIFGSSNTLKQDRLSSFSQEFFLLYHKVPLWYNFNHYFLYWC